MPSAEKILITILSSAVLTACSGSRPAIKQGVFSEGRIEVSTVGSPEPHKANIIIAILPFKNNTPDPGLDQTGYTLAELISAEMAFAKGFKLVERERLQEIFAEIKMGMTGVVNQWTAIRVGRLAGANVIAFGSFSMLGEKVLVSIRLVKVETDEIVGGASARGKSLSNLADLAQSAAEKLLGNLS